MSSTSNDNRPLPPPRDTATGEDSQSDSEVVVDNNNNTKATKNPPASHKVRVAVRVRPMNTKESSSAEIRQIVKTPSVPLNSVIVDGATPEQLANRRLTKSIVHGSQQFDGFYRVFSPHAEQEDVFEDTAKDIILDSFLGRNGSVMAYGPTGSGKTHSMFGSELSSPGLIPRASALIFRKKQELENFEGKYVTVRLWFVEVYNEEVRDLLNAGSKLQLRDRVSGGVGPQGSSCEVAGVRYVYPTSADQMLNLIEKGFSQRISHETFANQHSSRSHAILSIDIEVRETPESSSGLLGKMKFCDLAGSERAAATRNDGMRFREGANINKSLLALGAVVQALSKPNALQNFIPYRGSKLTRLLRESIGGNCSSILLVCVSPSSLAVEETLNTMHYATLAKKINTEVKVNTVEVSVDVLKQQFEVALSKKDQEIDSLKQELKKLYAERIAHGIQGDLADVTIEEEDNKNNNNNSDAVRRDPSELPNVSPMSQQRGSRLDSGNNADGGDHHSPSMSPDRMLNIATARLQALNRKNSREIATQTMNTNALNNHFLSASLASLADVDNINNENANNNNNNNNTNAATRRLSLSSVRQVSNGNDGLPPLSGFSQQNTGSNKNVLLDHSSGERLDDENNNSSQTQTFSSSSPLDALLVGDLARSTSTSPAFRQMNTRLNELREMRETIYKQSQAYGEASDLNLETAIRIASSEIVSYLGSHHVSKSEELDENGNVILSSSLVPVGVHGLKDDIATKRDQRSKYDEHREVIQANLLEYNARLAALNKEVFQSKEFSSEFERHELKHRIELQKERMSCLEAQEFAGFYLEEKKREHQLNNEFREALSRCGDILQRYLDILSFSGSEKDMDEFEKNAKYRREVQSLLEYLRAPVTETEAMVDVAVENFDEYCRFNAELLNQFKITLDTNIRKAREKKKLQQKTKQQLIAAESNFAHHDEELSENIENTLRELRTNMNDLEVVNRRSGNNNNNSTSLDNTTKSVNIIDDDDDPLNNTQSALDRARLLRHRKSTAVDVLADDINNNNDINNDPSCSTTTQITRGDNFNASTCNEDILDDTRQVEKHVKAEFIGEDTRQMIPSKDGETPTTMTTTKQETSSFDNSNNNNKKNSRQHTNVSETSTGDNTSVSSSSTTNPPVPFHKRVIIPAHLDVTKQNNSSGTGSYSLNNSQKRTILWNNQNVPLSTITSAASSSNQRRSALLLQQQEKQKEHLKAQQQLQQQQQEGSAVVSQAFWGNSTRRSRNALAHQISLKVNHSEKSSLQSTMTGRVSQQKPSPQNLDASMLAKTGGGSSSRSILSGDDGHQQNNNNKNETSLSLKSPEAATDFENNDQQQQQPESLSDGNDNHSTPMTPPSPGPAEKAALARAVEANTFTQNHYAVPSSSTSASPPSNNNNHQLQRSQTNTTTRKNHQQQHQPQHSSSSSPARKGSSNLKSGNSFTRQETSPRVGTKPTIHRDPNENNNNAPYVRAQTSGTNSTDEETPRTNNNNNNMANKGHHSSSSSYYQKQSSPNSSPIASGSSPTTTSKNNNSNNSQQQQGETNNNINNGTLTPFTFEKPKDANTSAATNLSMTSNSTSTSTRPTSGRVSAAQLRQQQKEQQEQKEQQQSATNISTTSINTTSSTTTTTSSSRNFAAPSNSIDTKGLKRVSELKEAFKKQMLKQEQASGSGLNPHLLHHSSKMMGAGSNNNNANVSSSSATGGGGATTPTSSAVRTPNAKKQSTSYASIHGGGAKKNTTATATNSNDISAASTPNTSTTKQQQSTPTSSSAPLVINYDDKRSNRLMDKLTKNAPGVPLTFNSVSNNNKPSSSSSTNTSPQRQQQPVDVTKDQADDTVVISDENENLATTVVENNNNNNNSATIDTDAVIQDDDEDGEESPLNQTTMSAGSGSGINKKNENVHNISAFQNLSALTVDHDDDDDDEDEDVEEEVIQGDEEEEKSPSPDPRAPAVANKRKK